MRDVRYLKWNPQNREQYIKALLWLKQKLNKLVGHLIDLSRTYALYHQETYSVLDPPPPQVFIIDLIFISHGTFMTFLVSVLMPGSCDQEFEFEVVVISWGL